MKHPTPKLTLGLAFLALVCLKPAFGTTINFSDSFEGSSFNPFWTVVQQNGTVSRVGDWRGSSEIPPEPRFQPPPHHT
jgi:hypothetical protein